MIRSEQKKYILPYHFSVKILVFLTFTAKKKYWELLALIIVYILRCNFYPTRLWLIILPLTTPCRWATVRFISEVKLYCNTGFLISSNNLYYWTSIFGNDVLINIWLSILVFCQTLHVGPLRILVHSGMFN